MKKRLLAFFLALCTALILLPGAALAEEAALAEAYGERVLTGADLWFYRQLKEKITQIANGELDSSEFVLDAAGQGLTYSNSSLHGVNTAGVLQLLLEDCPYELYWYDKGRGFEVSYSYSGFDRSVSSLKVGMYVAQEYAVLSADGKQYYPLRPDPQKTGAAAATARNAREVVAQYSALSDYEKLAAYRDYICGQVTYNRTAANSANYPYGNPWQLIYVFDNDPATNVVCEGYAKAFKYLCDLSSFQNRVECYTVSGVNGGDHMWNLVRINGRSYMADVTNCDENSSGMYGGLFLAGAADSTADGFTAEIPRFELGGGRYAPARSERYTYDSSTKELLPADMLKLAPTGYSRGMSFTDVVVGEYYIEPIDWAVERGIVLGYDDGKFGVGDACEQAHILTFLWRSQNKPEPAIANPYAALDPNEYYAKAAIWAYEKGLISDRNFDFGAVCTRRDVVTYLWKLAGSPRTGGTNPFTDVPAELASAVNWAAAKGVTKGVEETLFGTNDPCTREQIVTFLYRAYK